MESQKGNNFKENSQNVYGVSPTTYDNIVSHSNHLRLKAKTDTSLLYRLYHMAFQSFPKNLLSPFTVLQHLKANQDQTFDDHVLETRHRS